MLKEVSKKNTGCVTDRQTGRWLIFRDKHKYSIIIGFISVSNKWTTYYYMESSIFRFLAEQEIPAKTAGEEESFWDHIANV
jgi:hypothetical protein